MPKKSTKSKSKRTTLKQKYKLIKKVKEHHKKKRREDARKKRLGVKAPVPKDPGLPTQWPYKIELMREIDFELEKKRNFEQAKSLAKASRPSENRERSQNSRISGLDIPNLETLCQQADKRGVTFNLQKAKCADLNLAVGGVTNDTDNSRRAYYEDFLKVVEASDVIIQVLDVRDPLASRSLEVEHVVRSSNPRKRVVLLLNKIDLVPRENVQAWLTYFREEMPCVAFKCATGGAGNGGKKLGSRALPTQGKYRGADALGAETLVQLLKNYARRRNLKRAITVGIVGFPNVGKSSLINSLKRSRSAAAVGNTPGFTTVSKEITLDKNIKMIDSPGVVFASSVGESTASAALRNCKKIEKLTDPIAPVDEIIRRCPAEQLMLFYGTSKFVDVHDFLRQIGRLQGKLKKGGVPDTIAAARIVLNDWNIGRIPYYTNPPERCSAADKMHVGVEVVATWGEEFDAKKVFADEKSTVIYGIPAALGSENDFVFAKSAGVATLDTGESEHGSLQKTEDVRLDNAEEKLIFENPVATRKLTWASSGSKKIRAGGIERVEIKSTWPRENVFYDCVGQLNPNRARAIKNVAKKMKVISRTGSVGDQVGSDYDWVED